MPKPTPLSPLLRTAQRRSYAKGEIVLHQGDMPECIYILKRGEIKLYDIDEQGNEKIMHILQPPGVFPFAGYAVRQTEIMWFYAALTDVEAYILPYSDLRSRMERDGKLGAYLLEQIVEEMHEILVRLNSMNKTTARNKIIAALNFLVVYHTTSQRGGWRRVTFPVSHQLLADMTGITRESATITMGQLHEDELIRAPRLGILEINSARLND